MERMMSSPLRRWPLLEKMEDTAHPAGMRAPSKPSRSMFLTCLSLPVVPLLCPSLHFPMQSPFLENAERRLPPCISQKKRGNEKTPGRHRIHKSHGPRRLCLYGEL